MTDDPKRWIEDDQAPPALRAYLKDTTAPQPTLPVALRAQMREALLETHARDVDSAISERDERDERLVAEPRELAPRRGHQGAVFFAVLAAAVVLLGVVFYRQAGVVPPTPAVAPEPVDAGPDGPSLEEIEEIEVERVCGEREDSDQQCDLVVRLTHGYERLELHAANGIRAPSCGGSAEQHRESAEGELRFVLSDGASDAGWRAFTVCGFGGGVLLGAGSIEGERNIPFLHVSPRHGGDDVRIPVETIDDDITRLEVRWLPRAPGEAHWSPVVDGCPGEPILSLSRDAFEPLLGREGLSFFRHVTTPERAPTYVLCAISDAGAHHLRMPYGYPEYQQPFVRTLSGEVPLDQLATEVRVLGPGGIVTVTHLDASWPGNAANRRASERLLARMEAASALPPRELILANGQVLILPRGATLGPRSSLPESRVAHLRDGSTSVVLAENVLGTAHEGDAWRIVRDVILTSAGPASVYLDDVEVALFATGEEVADSRDTEPVEPIRVIPQIAYECHVEVLLELEMLGLEMPSDLESVAIGFVRHGGDVDVDTLPPMDCTTAALAMELPATAIAALPTDPDGVRRLALAFSDAPEGFNDLRDEGAYCSAPYAVIACVRDASGLHALPDARGRWAWSGMACFAGDTPVATEDGATPIASLRPGDRVLGFEPNRGETALTTVTRLLPRGERAILTLTLSNGAALRVTPEHPLFDAAGGVFRRAETFVVGDRLRGIDGRDVVVFAVSDRGDRTEVFDLSVTGPHTYFAGGIVAHNY